MNFIWDLDGTLFDSYGVINAALFRTLERAGIAFDREEAKKEIIRTSVRKYLSDLGSEKELQRVFDEEHDALTDSITLIPHAKQTLVALTADGARHFVATHRNETALRALKRNGIYEMFTEVVTSIQGFARKPAPDSVNYLIEKHSLKREETFYVGDRSLDIECARNAGIGAILFYPDGSGAVVTGKEDYIIKDLSEVTAIAREAGIINAALEYIKSLFENEFSGHDYWHSVRVYKMAKTIAQREGADVFTVSIAALLHDADDVKLSPETYKNKDNARAFMAGQGISEETQTAVIRMIDEVSFRGTDSVTPSSLEGMCVQDADRLDALGAIGAARTFAYGGSHKRAIYTPGEQPVTDMDEAAYRASSSCSINHFYEKLFKLPAMMNTDSAKKAAAQREGLMRDFIAAFLREWDGEI